MLYKGLAGFIPSSLEIKAEGDQGIVSAAFATLNVVDLDGDLTEPGAFGSQDVRMAQWGHDWASLPIGRGRIREQGDQAIFDGSFFLDTDHGKNSFATVKGLGDLQEWSYGFDVLDWGYAERDGRTIRILKKMKVHEVSPVMLGAGVGTHTLDIKGLDPEGQPFVTASLAASKSLADFKAFVDRAVSLADLRAKEGRVLSQANRDRLLAFAEDMRSQLAMIDELLTSTGKGTDEDAAKARAALGPLFREFMEMTRPLSL